MGHWGSRVYILTVSRGIFVPVQHAMNGIPEEPSSRSFAGSLAGCASSQHTRAQAIIQCIDTRETVTLSVRQAFT